MEPDQAGPSPLLIAIVAVLGIALVAFVAVSLMSQREGANGDPTAFPTLAVPTATPGATLPVPTEPIPTQPGPSPQPYGLIGQGWDSL
jgi:hypothetical protein